MSKLGHSLQVIDIGKISREFANLTQRAPETCLWTIGPPLRYLEFIPDQRGKSSLTLLTEGLPTTRMERVAAESLGMLPQLARTERVLTCSCLRLLTSTILRVASQGASRPREGTIPPEQFGSTNINLTSARQRTRGD
jgi:hypothetical protein